MFDVITKHFTHYVSGNIALLAGQRLLNEYDLSRYRFEKVVAD